MLAEQDGNNDLEWIYSEADEAEAPEPESRWKVLIVDDEAEVHRLTKMVLKHFQYEGKGLQFFSGYGGGDARLLLEEHPDTAVILLDVVMERDDAGLQFVKHVRDRLNNKHVRIILRTGQPGQAPERHVVRDYDINDYKEKTELTTEKLYTSVYTSLRNYRIIAELEEARRSSAQSARELELLNQNLERIVEDKTKDLQAKNRQLRDSMWETASALVEVSLLEERNRIAKQIHDIAGHTLTGSIVQSGWIRKMIPDHAADAHAKLEMLEDHLRSGLDQMRAAVHMLREQDQPLDFRSILVRFIAEAQEKMGIRIDYRIDPEPGAKEDCRTIIYHALQEGLTNGVRHGRSTHFEFSLTRKEAVVEFRLKDNGCGFERLRLGFGLSAMKEQIERSKGAFRLESGTGTGCLLTFTLPAVVEGGI